MTGIAPNVFHIVIFRILFEVVKYVSIVNIPRVVTMRPGWSTNVLRSKHYPMHGGRHTDSSVIAYLHVLHLIQRQLIT